MTGTLTIVLDLSQVDGTAARFHANDWAWRLDIPRQTWVDLGRPVSMQVGLTPTAGRDERILEHASDYPTTEGGAWAPEEGQP